MADGKRTIDSENGRPFFPKRAVITAGMPYGNKTLHFGHIGGVFVQADVYARFLRDRIGAENVIFVSGTDCYGSPIAEGYRKKREAGEFDGTIEQFVQQNHDAQKATLDRYEISLDLFGASGLEDTKAIHAAETDEFIRGLYSNGYLKKLTTRQFYDAKFGVFLNGRQVIGRCPVAGCKSEKGYADECDLGHQYMPVDLIDPKSTLSGETPEMRDVDNWYFDLIGFGDLMRGYVDRIRRQDNVRPIVANTINEFLIPPVIYVMNDYREAYEAIRGKMAPHRLLAEEGKTSFTLEFAALSDRDDACGILTSAGVRFRTGKTLVPFRLTGNIDWGVPAPSLEGESGLTVWVWPESLWAPISFTKALLQRSGKPQEDWKKWWCSRDAEVFQFIGQDNIYFYGIAQQAMWMAQQGPDKAALQVDAPEGRLQPTTLVANYHILFLDKKASSSGAVKPPMADDLLNYYTPEQLRAHFLGLGLGLRSVSFQPKPLNPNAKPEDADPALKEGNLLTNVFNRVARSCFYTAQKSFGGRIPAGSPDAETLKGASDAILAYERAMYLFEFHTVMTVMDNYIRGANKYFSKASAEAEKNDDDALRRQMLVNAFHMVKTSMALMHPVAPAGTETLRRFLRLPEDVWSWNHIFETVGELRGEDSPALEELPPRFDFFAKHESQLVFDK